MHITHRVGSVRCDRLYSGMQRPLLCWARLLAMLPIAMAASAVGQSLIWSAEQTLGASDGEAFRPRIAMAAEEPVVVWGAAPSDIRFARDPGNGFLDPVPVDPPGMDAWATGWAGADIAVHGDTMIVVYSTGALGVVALYASRSTDGGISWPDTVRLAPEPGLEARFPTVTYVPSQGPTVLYMEFEPDWQDPRYVMVASMDGGASYGMPIAISAPIAPGEPCDCCTGQAVGKDAVVAALFRNNDDNVRTIWSAISADGGTSYPVGAEIDATEWVHNACSASGPDGYIAGDSLRYVWMSGASNGIKVHYGSALLSDLTVGSNALIHPGQSNVLQQNFPRIAGNGDTLGVVWEQTYQGQREILFRWSVSGWAGLSAPDTVNAVVAGPQRNPDIAYANGTFHLVWEDNPSGTLTYRSASLDLQSGLHPNFSVPALRAWPNPVRDVLHMDLPIQARRIEIRDASGRLVMQEFAQRTIDVSTLGQGVYMLQLFTSDQQIIGITRFSR